MTKIMEIYNSSNPCYECDPCQNVILEEQRNIIEKQMSRLTPRKREVLNLYYGLGFYGEERGISHSYREISEKLNISPTAVRDHLIMAKLRLKNPLRSKHLSELIC